MRPFAVVVREFYVMKCGPTSGRRSPDVGGPRHAPLSNNLGGWEVPRIAVVSELDSMYVHTKSVPRRASRDLDS
jgi:hypothetical protein